MNVFFFHFLKSIKTIFDIFLSYYIFVLFDYLHYQNIYIQYYFIWINRSAICFRKANFIIVNHSKGPYPYSSDNAKHQFDFMWSTFPPNITSKVKGVFRYDKKWWFSDAGWTRYFSDCRFCLKKVKCSLTITSRGPKFYPPTHP